MENKFVLFTDDQSRRYEEFVDSDFDKTDEALGIRYQKQDIYDDTVLLLRYNCPEESCEAACFGWPDLHKHVRNVHHKVMCDLCTRNKKVFTHEHELFTPHELRKHERFGDDNPGAIDQSGFKGHPECGFCRRRFYGDDELFTHCREKHERCHICDRRNTDRQPQYFTNYESLEQHFTKDHYLCPDPNCQEAKFVVFESEMDLKAHQIAEHSNDLSKDVRRDRMAVNMSSFAYRESYQENNRPRRGGGRGRDPNSEHLPPSSAQPMRRDELAYQRQMEIQSAQSIRPRTFGGQLTTADNGPSRGGRVAPRFQSSIVPEWDAASPAGLLPTETSGAAPSLQDQARQLQHDAVTARASSMLYHDQTKIVDFRSRVSSYKSSAITATQLVDTLLTLFDASSSDLGTLIKELAALYENEAKRTALLAAWNDWRAINEDYPSLPGPVSGVAPATSISAGGNRRILKLKSSTAQSSRSAANRQSSWGRTAAPATGSALSGPRVGAAVPWTGPSSGTTSRHCTPRVSRSAVAPAPAPSAEAFPALPQAAKPSTTMWGVHSGRVGWDERRGPPAANPWAGKSNGASDAEPDDGEQNDAAAAGGKKKGRKKQTLYKFG